MDSKNDEESQKNELLSEKQNTFLKGQVSRLEKKLKELEAANEKNSKLKALIETNTYIANSLEKDEVLKRIFDQIKRLLGCELSSILLVNPDLNQLVFTIVSKEEEAEILKSTNLNMGEGIAGSVWQNGIPMIINDVQNDPRFSNRIDKKVNAITRSLIAVPLTVDGIVIGVIEAINKIGDEFTQFDLSMLQYISTQSAIAIKNADLFNMAITDGMTKLYIHKHFHERLIQEWDRSIRKKSNLSLVMFDIDHFKEFNDSFGHQAGDLIITEFGRILRDNCRSIDIPCRYGGEEMAVILPETNKDEALVFAERIHTLIAKTRIIYEGRTLNITISGGIASTPHLKPASAEEFIKMVDLALYHSKKTGRNKLTYYDDSIPKIDCNE
jgi:diguanylate cyclase (GGDEF)-like protein